MTTCGPSETGRMKDVLSTEAGVFVDTMVKKATLSMKTDIFVDRVVKLMASARKQGLFLAVKGKLIALARKRAVFMAAKVADPKETPSKGCLCNMYTVTRRISAASSASARCSQNIEAAGTPGPTEGSGRYAPDRGCQRQLTGVKIIAKKKPGGQPGEFFACYKRNKFIC